MALDTDRFSFTVVERYNDIKQLAVYGCIFYKTCVFKTVFEPFRALLASEFENKHKQFSAHSPKGVSTQNLMLISIPLKKLQQIS